jgi:hypothetical protein
MAIDFTILEFGNVKMNASSNKYGKGFGFSTMAQHAPSTNNKSRPTSNGKSNYFKKVKQEHDAISRGRCSSLAALLYASILKLGNKGPISHKKFVKSFHLCSKRFKSQKIEDFQRSHNGGNPQVFWTCS